jgi:sugar phosphate isomerase/epimerase
MNRRSFVSGITLTGLGLVGANAFGAQEKSQRELAVFTKYLEKLPYDELAKVIAPLGVTGLEAPLRKGGHIEPEDLSEKLPAFVAALAKQDLSVVVMASSIDKVDKKGLTEKQLRAAAGAGIKKYRLQHLKYDLSKPIKPQIAEFTAQLKDLAVLNKEIGIQGLYQNHRGRDFVGGPIWDMVGMLEEIDIKELGLAFDFAHATVEGANAWQMNFRRAIPHIGAVFLKDYKLENGTWQACPIGEGMVDPLAGKLISKMLPKEIPISIHIEYVNGEDVVARTVEAMKSDLATVRKWLA